jgi:hypothetical protein
MVMSLENYSVDKQKGKLLQLYALKSSISREQTSNCDLNFKCPAQTLMQTLSLPIIFFLKKSFIQRKNLLLKQLHKVRDRDNMYQE